MARSPRTYVGLAATVAFFALGWWLLGPAQLGGPTSYAVLSGTSMEPRLERGDLVLTRAKPSYRVGEVVLYEDHETGSRVLHRIIAERDGRFVTKGDNNDFIDPVHPVPDEVVGKFWFSVPAAGTVLAWLKRPVNLAILLTLLVLLGLGSGREVSRRRVPAGRPVLELPDGTAGRPLMAPHSDARSSAPARSRSASSSCSGSCRGRRAPPRRERPQSCTPTKARSRTPARRSPGPCTRRGR